MQAQNLKVDYDFNLKNKVAVITGAASGLGLAIAQAYLQKGAKIAALDLNKQLIHNNLVDENVKAYECNVTNQESVDKTIQQIIKDYTKIDILVNSAGIVDLAPSHKISIDAWQRTLDVNLTGSFLVAQSVGKTMIENNYGKIINIASQAGSVAIEDHVAYCASKFGVIGLTKSLALEWGKFGINVNSISPTIVMTELGKKAWQGEKGEQMKTLIPTGRFAEPEEIAATAIFLASNASDMINGADIVIDGGYTIK